MIHLDHLTFSDLPKISLSTGISLIELQILLMDLLKVNKTLFITEPATVVNSENTNKFLWLIQQRLKHVPLAYLINKTVFWDLDLFIDHNVLIPRHATEVLVAQVLQMFPKNSAPRILELATGSGAIGLAIAKHLPKATVIATDLSSSALAVATKNAEQLGIKNIEFIWSDWFKHEYFLRKPKFELIISNPPYIDYKDLAWCDPEIFQEPTMALFADQGGLDCLEHIINYSVNYLSNNGMLILEHGFNQQHSVIMLLQQAGFSEIMGFKDLDQLDRMVQAKYTCISSKCKF